MRSTSSQTLLLGFDRSGEPSSSCLCSNAWALDLASTYKEPKRLRASGVRLFPHLRCSRANFLAAWRLIHAVWSAKWSVNHSSTHGFENAIPIWFASASRSAQSM